MAAKGGLGGKGLSALFTDNEANVRVDTSGVPAEEIEITLIDRNPNQPRKTFKEESLKEMATSIAAYGVLQPLLLVKNGDRYLIIAGERRFRAALMAGLKTVPAIVREFTDQQIQEISLIENLHREDLNAIEAAEGMKELMDNHGLTQEDVAQRIGKSRPYVTNTLRLLQLPAEVADMVRNGDLSPGHARALISIDDKDYLITLAKRGDLHARRQAAKFIFDNETGRLMDAETGAIVESKEEGKKVMPETVLRKLFAELGKKYANRNGGYTRIYRMPPRRGDATEMALIQIV